MRQLLIVIFFLNSGITFGQNFSYPPIDTHGKTIADFIPTGWILLDSTTGDLNNDRQKDLAFVIQYRDSIPLVNNEDNFPDTVITQPRILVIAFYNPSRKEYELIEQSNTFILNHDNPGMDEPFQKIFISKDILQIDFQIFMNMGGWEMSDNFYKFRYKDNEFLLIGADYNSTNRGSGETEFRSYNFLTKKVKTTTGNFSIPKQKIVWRKFVVTKLKTLKTFAQPFTWEVEKDYYL